MSDFVFEHEVYSIFEQLQVRTPKYMLVRSDEDVDRLAFQSGQNIVIKAVAENLWHKSDEGGLAVVNFEPGIVRETITSMQAKLRDRFPWHGALVCEYVESHVADGVPSEGFLGFRWQRTCGWTVQLGLGGGLVEAWQHELTAPFLWWPLALYSPEEALAELKDHFLGRVWLGRFRQQKPVTSDSRLLTFLQRIWRLPEVLEQKGIASIEANPLIINLDGDPTVLDGVGVRAPPSIRSLERAGPLADKRLLRPESIGIIGVSSKKEGAGDIILKHIARSKIPQENVKVIKPGYDSWDGFPCFNDISALKDQPVDLLILCLPVKPSLEIFKALPEQGGGAHFVYMVAGGEMPESGHRSCGSALRDLVLQYREQGKWHPRVLGPNGIGMLLRKPELNTFFIPDTRLKVDWERDSNIAIVSQSGALLISLLSRDPYLSPRYGFSIGNQSDLCLSDYLNTLVLDEELRVIGLYVEGFTDLDIVKCAEVIHKRKGQLEVLVLKGGKSKLGQAAALSHTDALADDYELEERALKKAGVFIAESKRELSCALKWLKSPSFASARTIALISNAGFEDVTGSDFCEQYLQLDLYHLVAEDRKALQEIIRRHGLAGLVQPEMPMDLSPMAGEKVWLDVVGYLAQRNIDLMILGLVPMTPMLNSDKPTEVENFATNIHNLAETFHTQIGVAIDAGRDYQHCRDVYERVGLPTFSSLEDALAGLRPIFPKDRIN